MRRARGFTLVELLVVIAICALVAAMAGASMRSNRGEKAGSFSRAMVSHVNMVRHTAMTLQQPARLVAQLNGTVYQLSSQAWSPSTGAFQDLGATLNVPVDVLLCTPQNGAAMSTGSTPACPMAASFAICVLASGGTYLQSPVTTTCPSSTAQLGATIFVTTVTGDKKYKLPLFGLTGMAKLQDQW